MFRLSDKLARLEDRISGRWGKKLDRFFDRRKGKWKFYIPLGLFCWYFYGMLINSVHLGIKSTFNATGDPVGSIWVVNPFRNLLAVFTPTGLGVTQSALSFFVSSPKRATSGFPATSLSGTNAALTFFPMAHTVPPASCPRKNRRRFC